MPGLLALLLVPPTHALAQTRIDVDVRCAECSLDLEPLARLAGDRISGEPMAIARTREGTFVISFYPVGEEVVEFDAEGAFRRVIAQRGEGPGEVTRARHIQRAAGDSIWIFDTGRVLVFTPDLEYHRTERLPVPFIHRAVRLHGGDIIANVGTPMRGMPDPLHRIVDGRIAASFGAESADPVGPGTPHLVIRSLTTDGSARIWSAPLVRYEIREWDAQGGLVHTWRAPAEHFTPWTEFMQLNANAPPRDRVGFIQWLRGSLVLVVVAVAAPDWRDHLGPPSLGPEGGTIYRAADTSRLFVTRLEVLDLDSGRILTTRTERPNVTAPIDREHVAGYEQDALGNPAINVWRVRFRSGR